MADATYQPKVYRDAGGDRITIAEGGELRIEGAVVGALPSTSYFVDTVNGSDSNDGKSWSNAFATMDAAFDAVADHGRIYVIGDVREELLTPLGVQGVAIIGATNGH